MESLFQSTTVGLTSWLATFLSAILPMSLKRILSPFFPTCLRKLAFSPFKRISVLPSPSQSTRHNLRRPLFPAVPKAKRRGFPFSSQKILLGGSKARSPERFVRL